ncbi:RNA-directed DNA polymerase [Oceanobacillus kimchii]|uniref:RNA-directed DNA polymerase n=1 Tax=Oceanobacillus kimchii TaxID=746691 RepID=UPI0003477D81|nr:RNA-directed DNA polymerase [Oceanobacillus kimchii]
MNVPTPYHQIKLSEAILEHRDKLEEFYSNSIISLTKPIFNENAERAIEREFPFKEKTLKRIEGIACKKYILKTDISRYYPTIYTHSIPWAMHGKRLSKDRQTDCSLLGNKLDKLIRNMQDGQTLGIPTGPDTSLIISEVIGTAIDKRLQEMVPNIKGFRYTDDIELYFDTLSEAENCLNKLHKIVREFELELNPHKTEIIMLPEAIEPSWVPEIKLYDFRDSVEGERNDLISFFSRAFELAKLYPNDGVLKYSVQRIPSSIKDENWSILESLLLSSITIDSTTLPIVRSILFENELRELPLNKVRIVDTLEKIIKLNIELGNDYEVLWSLSICKLLDLKVSEGISKLLNEYDNPFISIMTMNLYEKGFINNLDLSLYQSHLNKNSLYGSNWIFSYEAIRKNWFHVSENYVEEDEFYSQLLEENVTFYDELEWGSLVNIDPFDY